MMHVSRRLALGAWFGASLALCQPVLADTVARKAGWAAPVSASRNFYQVSPTLYRSAQLDKDGLPILTSLGIKTVVSLRAFHDDRSLLRGSGIQMRRVKVYTWDIDDNKVIAALREIRTAEQAGPVLLHCQHGADRTGLVSAMYRIVFQNWDREQAIDELEHGGYGFHGVWRNIPTYLRQVDLDKIRRGVEAV